MNGEEYIALLLERQAQYEKRHPPKKPWARPLLEWFIRDGDEAIVDLPAPVEKPKPAPRTYRTAASLREERDRLVARAEALSDSATLPDRAATHGVALGRKRTAKAQQSADRKLAAYVALDKRIRALDQRIALAEKREEKP